MPLISPDLPIAEAPAALSHEEDPALSASQFQVVFDSMPQLGWVARPDGYITFYNQGWYGYTGTTLEQMMGWGWQSVHDPELLPIVMQRWQHSINRGSPFEMEFPLRRADGVFRWFLTRVNPIRDASGTLLRWVGVNTDIDERKQADAERAELLARVETANRAKDVFLAKLGHELRNPLSPILSALQLMNTRGETAAQKERDMIEWHLRHVVKLVDDLLDVTLIKRGMVEIQRKPGELFEAVARAVEMVTPLVEERSLRLTLMVPASGLLANMDQGRITQVFTNLLTNAARYTSQGGLIDLRAERDGDFLVVSVRDNGAGIAPEMISVIFDEFAQADRVTTRARGGLGLGLSIARSLIEMHGGTLSATSDGIGMGSEFVVRLPGLAARVAPLPAALAIEKRARAAHRVLVVDDNFDGAELLAESLTLMGYDTRIAADGRGALALVDEFQPQVALIDIGLPDMSGYQLARRLRQRSGLKALPIIAITGYGQSSDRERSRAEGFAAHLVKPIDVDALHPAIEKALESPVESRVESRGATAS